MLDPGSAHDGLMVVVAHRVCVGEPLEERNIALLHVVEAHRVAAGIVTARDADVRIQIVAAAGRVGSARCGRTSQSDCCHMW